MALFTWLILGKPKIAKFYNVLVMAVSAAAVFWQVKFYSKPLWVDGSNCNTKHICTGNSGNKLLGSHALDLQSEYC